MVCALQFNSMAEIEVPQYFVCPISLQIMKDPVTAVTGITYDRESIEQWLTTAKESTCPVTKQPLPRNSDLTPNHTLLRLIQSWCLANSLDIPTPKPPLEKTHIQKLLRELKAPHLCQTALEKIISLARENERNRKCMIEAGVAKAMVPIIVNGHNEGKTMATLEEALRILRHLWSDTILKPLVGENLDFINSLTWILQLRSDNNNVNIVNEAMPVLKSVVEAADSTLLGNLTVDFFEEILKVLKKRVLSQQAIKSALQVLKETSPLGRNRMRIVESGAVFELIELELQKPENGVTELVFILLAHLCSCADGREQFLNHAGSIAVVSKRILRVSPATDDRAIHLFSLIAKYSASNDVVLEMLRVGAVSKLCMVMQADCGSHLKEKARGILRLHSRAWNNSPCIQVYLLTRDQS